MDPNLEGTFLLALEQNHQKLLRVCSVYAADAHDKKDLFQEAVIQIWQSLPSFEAKASLSTWMFRITLNVCLRLQSKEARKQETFRRLDSLTIEPAVQEDASAAEQEQLLKLRRCIQQLHDGDKAVITLYLEELSYKDIADITGLTENNVAVKIKRIKSKLLTCITERV